MMELSIIWNEFLAKLNILIEIFANTLMSHSEFEDLELELFPPLTLVNIVAWRTKSRE